MRYVRKLSLEKSSASKYWEDWCRHQTKDIKNEGTAGALPTQYIEALKYSQDMRRGHDRVASCEIVTVITTQTDIAVKMMSRRKRV
jgi:hypothetical protein